MSTHLAAVCVAQGKPFEVQSRPTPKPGPGELLIAVKSTALNPADHFFRDHGYFMKTYPAIVGFDISGVVLEIGDGVPAADAAKRGEQLCFTPGQTRVAAYCAGVWRSCAPDYGAFQERVLVPWQHAVPLPDESMSWNHAATLPVSVQVPMCAWDALGVPRLGESAPPSGQASGSASKEAVLIWGASSSVGTMGVQSARLLRDDKGNPYAAVYATCGSANMNYVSSLGADRVFDHRDLGVVDAIVSAAKKDGMLIRHCYLAAGDLGPCQAVLKAFLANDDEVQSANKSKIASAPRVPPDAAVLDGMETIFLMPSMNDEEARLEQYRYWMGTWLRENLEKGTIKPSPEPKVIGKGVEAINAGVDMMIKGVSCMKLIVEIEE